MKINYEMSKMPEPFSTTAPFPPPLTSSREGERGRSCEKE